MNKYKLSPVLSPGTNRIQVEYRLYTADYSLEKTITIIKCEDYGEVVRIQELNKSAMARGIRIDRILKEYYGSLLND